MLPNILWVTKQHTVNWIQIGRGGAYSWGIIIRCIIYFVDGTFTGGGGGSSMAVYGCGNFME